MSDLVFQYVVQALYLRWVTQVPMNHIYAINPSYLYFEGEVWV